MEIYVHESIETKLIHINYLVGSANEFPLLPDQVHLLCNQSNCLGTPSDLEMVAGLCYDETTTEAKVHNNN